MNTRAILAITCLLALSTGAHAGCMIAQSQGLPCVEDSRGNQYVTRPALGGGYKTFKNGQPYSKTQKTLDGRYREKLKNGKTRTFSFDPWRVD